ncbi:MAG: PAS domain S-box protein [Bacteroidales bacterium]|nr:PAS domain S-box protein [Bacteroidales bacterium]
MKIKSVKINSSSDFKSELKLSNNKILNFAILISILFAIPGLIGTYTRFKTIGLSSLVLYQFILLFLLILIYLLRNKTSFRFRFISYVSLLTIFLFSYVFNVGMLGYWSLHIVFISLIISVFYEKKYAFVVLSLLTVMVLAAAYLFYNKYLGIKFDIITYLSSYNIWLVMIVTFLYISIVTIFIVGKQREFFTSSVEQLNIAKESALISEKKFKNIFNSSSNSIVISDFEGKILEVNKTLLNFIGISEEELKNKTVRDFVLPEYYTIINEKANSLVDNQLSSHIEIAVKTSQNQVVPLEVNTILIDYENQKAVFSVLHDISERKKLEQKILSTIIQTEERERSRFAKELHDGVGPLLSATKIYAKALHSCENEEERLYTIMKLNDTVNEAIISAQEIANNLSPHVLRNFGIKGAIESFFLKINKTSKIMFDFHTNIDYRLDENIETTLYRVLVELINNSIKYSKANLITIVLIAIDGSISMNYSDNGVGFDLETTIKNNTGMGLSNIISRIKSLNGKINMQSDIDKGIEVDVKIAI